MLNAHDSFRICSCFLWSTECRFARQLDVSDFCKLVTTVPSVTPTPAPALGMPALGMLKSAEELVAECTRPPVFDAHTTYHLTAVVRHIGGPDSGHYVVYRRVATLLQSDASGHPLLPMSGSHSSVSLSSCESASTGVDSKGNSPVAAGSGPPPPPLHWVRVSDTHVEEVDENEVLDSEAYMLYYMRGDISKKDDTALVVPHHKDDRVAEFWYPLLP